MNYLSPVSLSADETMLAAWDSQVVQAAEDPFLAAALQSGADVFPRFAAFYGQLRALPRGARRALQRHLARSREPAAIPPLRQRKLAGSLAGAALLLALAQGAQAATITVNTTIPKINSSDGLCSLIEAIVNANDDAATHADCAAGSGADTIGLPAASTLTVTNTYVHYHGATGLPTITSDITIDGNGSKIAAKKGAGFRLFAVESSGDLTLDNATVSGGSQRYGGTIFNYGALTITDSTVTGGKAGLGGGIFNASGAVLTIDSSTISKHSAGYGGGIYDFGGTVSVSYSTITGNKAFVDGGGIYEYAGTLDVSYSTISKNTSGRDGAGLHNRDSAVTVTYSTISGNKTGFFGYGGGIYDRSSETLVENSTISGNTAAVGGGVYNRATLTVSNSTISKNNAADGGGISTSRDLTLKRSLISGNSAFFARNVDRFSGTVTRDNYNMFGSNNYDGVRGFSVGASDIVPNVGITSILAPLAANGGPTLTHALVVGSPAIDASPADADCTATDQRGVLRPQGASCDIGAFEK
jgi:hypothetical protein